MEMIPVRLGHVIIDEQNDSHAVILVEIAGERRLSIGIGAVEAMAIQRGVVEDRFPRPLTHDLMAIMLTALRGDLQAVHIHDMQQGTYFAELLIQRGEDHELRIDARPSDALALAVRVPGCQLLVAEELLDYGQDAFDLEDESDLEDE